MQIQKSFGTEQFISIFSVMQEHDGMRLDQFVQLFLRTKSRQFIKKKIYSSEITIQKTGRSTPHRPSAKVHLGEEVRFVVNRPAESQEFEKETWMGESIELNREPSVVYEDDDILVISKPPFMATHPTGKHFFNCATVFFENKYKKTIHSIHRLDRETSGLLVMGKNSQRANEISFYFENRFVKKAYFFIAHKESQDISFPFIASERIGNSEALLGRVLMETYPESDSRGKTSVTTFRLVHENDQYVLGLAFPKTGRQHQIRVHAKTHGMPLLGDKIYNGDLEIFKRYKDGLATLEDYEKMQIPRHALHAVALNFPYEFSHPRHLKKGMNLQKVDLPTTRETHIDHLPKDLLDWITKNMSISLSEIQEKMTTEINKEMSKS